MTILLSIQGRLRRRMPATRLPFPPYSFARLVFRPYFRAPEGKINNVPKSTWPRVSSRNGRLWGKTEHENETNAI